MKITYDNGITQIFDVITKDRYDLEIAPIKDQIYYIECMSSKQFKKNKGLLNELKARLAKYGKYCVVGSPIYNSVDTQILSLHKNQGGDHKVTAVFI